MFEKNLFRTMAALDMLEPKVIDFRKNKIRDLGSFHKGIYHQLIELYLKNNSIIGELPEINAPNLVRF